MEQQYLPESRLRWSRHWFSSKPIWPTEPDCAAITRLAASVLACGPDLLSVKFFDEGACNKLFEVRHKLIDVADTSLPVYLLRVSLPVDPFYKTESEVATLKYLGLNTGIPVATVIAWDSSPKNSIGYEWILLETLPGVELAQVWRKIPWDEKLNLARSLAEYSIQLWSCRFDTIGSLYLNDWEAQKDYASKIGKSEFSTHSGNVNAGFVVGPIVAGFYFEERRLHIPSDRGPYLTSHDYMKERIVLQTSHTSTEIGLLKSVTNEKILNELDEEYLEKGDDIMELCKGYMEALPTMFPSQDSIDGPFILCHEDLHESNILVDPETFAITGIIDWEMTTIVPSWQARSVPKLIDNCGPAESPMFDYYWRKKDTSDGGLIEEPPRPENYEIGDDDSSETAERSFAIDKRDVWDEWLLRKAFSEALASLGVHVEASGSEKRKQMFARAVSKLHYDWREAVRPLKGNFNIDDD